MAFLDEAGLAEVWKCVKEECDETVGDLLDTLRTDVDSSWVLCDGARVSAEEYPKLCQLMLGINDLTYRVWDNVADVPMTSVSRMIYADGKYVLAGTYNTSARVAWATSIHGPWTTNDLWSNSYGVSVNDIAFAEGYWAVCGTVNTGSSSSAARIAFVTSLDETWTITDFYSSGNRYAQGYSITYGNGYWVAAGRRWSDYVGRSVLSYATSITGPWTHINDTFGNDNEEKYNIYANFVRYVNGYFVAGGGNTQNSSKNGIAYATTPNSWTHRGMSIISFATEVDGNIVGGFTDGTIRRAPTPGGTWTSVSNPGVGGISNIVQIGDYWFACGGSGLAWSTSLEGPWTFKNLTSECGTTAVRNVAVEDGILNAVGNNGKIGCNTDDVYAPVLSGNGTVYIKGRARA